MGLTFENMIAHNVENISRESGTIELDSDMLKFIAMELGQIIQNEYVVPAHETLFKVSRKKNVSIVDLMLLFAQTDFLLLFIVD